MSLPTNITQCWVKIRFRNWRSGGNPATTPPPTEPRRLLEITEKFCYYPPPLNRVGFWRSRKRLKKFNNLNLAALHLDYNLCTLVIVGTISCVPSETQCFFNNDAHATFLKPSLHIHMLLGVLLSNLMIQVIRQ